ncbi:unnamed protein product, partial [Didymodactylos carnosus]
FGLFQDPFEIDLFDFDMSIFLECCLRNHELSSNGQTLTSQATAVSSIVSIGGVHPGTSSVNTAASETSLSSSSNIQYYLSKLLPLPISSSNVYLKPILGLSDVLSLNYIFHSASDGSRLEKIDTKNLLALNGFDSNVTTITGAHTQLNNHPFTSSNNIENYYNSTYMLLSQLTSTAATGIPPPPPSPMMHTYLIQDAGIGLTNFDKLNKQQQEKYSKLKYTTITKKNKRLSDLLASKTPRNSLTLDFWSVSEQTDCQRLFSTNQISLNPFYLNDIQPPVIGRYVKVTLIGKYNVSSSSLRLPCSYFFGYPFVITKNNRQEQLEKDENNKKQLSVIEEHYETIVVNYSLHRNRLVDLLNNLSPTDNDNVNNTIKKVYRECLFYQMQMNIARRNIEKCRQLVKQNVNDDENNEQHKKTPISKQNQLKLESDSVHSNLYELFDYSVRRTHDLSLDNAWKLFAEYGINHLYLNDMFKRLLKIFLYYSWWPEFVQICLQNYFVNDFKNIHFSYYKKNLFCSLIDLWEQTLLPMISLSSSNVSTIQDLLLYTQYQWLLSFLHRLSDKQLIPVQLTKSILNRLKTALYRSNTNATTTDIENDENDQTMNLEQPSSLNNVPMTLTSPSFVSNLEHFLNTSSIIHTPRSNSIDNYRNKRKEMLIKKATKTAVATQTILKTSASTQTNLSLLTKKENSEQPATTWFNQMNVNDVFVEQMDIDQENSSFLSYFCNRQLCLNVTRSLVKLLINSFHNDNKNINNDYGSSIPHDLFLLICKCLSNITRSCYPVLILDEFLTNYQLKLLLGYSSGEIVDKEKNIYIRQSSPWIQHAINGLLLDLIDNENFSEPNERKVNSINDTILKEQQHLSDFLLLKKPSEDSTNAMELSSTNDTTDGDNVLTGTTDLTDIKSLENDKYIDEEDDKATNEKAKPFEKNSSAIKNSKKKSNSNTSTYYSPQQLYGSMNLPDEELLYSIMKHTFPSLPIPSAIWDINLAVLQSTTATSTVNQKVLRQSTCCDIVQISLDNRLDGTLYYVLDLYTMNRSYNIQASLETLCSAIIYNVFCYDIKMSEVTLAKSTMVDYHRQNETACEMINNVLESMFYDQLPSTKTQSIATSYSLLANLDRLLTNYLTFSLLNYSRSIDAENKTTTQDTSSAATSLLSLPVNQMLKPLIYMSTNTLEHILNYIYQYNDLLTPKIWHHLFTLLFYTSINKQSAYHMKTKWFNETADTVFIHVLFQFFKASYEMFDENTLEMITNYLERLFMCEEQQSETIKGKRTAEESNPTVTQSIIEQNVSCNRLYLNSLITILNRFITDNFYMINGPLNCHLKLLNYYLKIDFTNATVSKKTILIKSIIDFVWNYIRYYSTLNFTLNNVHPLMCFLNYDRKQRLLPSVPSSTVCNQHSTTKISYKPPASMTPAAAQMNNLPT